MTRAMVNATHATLAVLRAQASIEPVRDLSAEQIAHRCRCIGADLRGSDVRKTIYALRRNGHIIERSTYRGGRAGYRIVIGLARPRQLRLGGGVGGPGGGPGRAAPMGDPG